MGWHDWLPIAAVFAIIIYIAIMAMFEPPEE